RTCAANEACCAACAARGASSARWVSGAVCDACQIAPCMSVGRIAIANLLAGSARGADVSRLGAVSARVLLLHVRVALTIAEIRFERAQLAAQMDHGLRVDLRDA